MTAFARVAVLALAFAACSGGTSNDSAPPPSDPADPADKNEVTPMDITVDHPELGALTFAALQAGDPSAATEGRLVLLLHGFPESAEAYRDFLVPLADAGYYAVAISQRGYSPGARPEGVEAYNILELVGDVTSIAAELGAEQYHLVGHDWGGAVAWLAAAFNPGAVSSLTSLSTPHPDAMNAAVTDPAHPEQAAAFGYMEIWRAEGSEDQFLTDGASTFKAIFGAGGGLPSDKVDAYADLLATPEALRAALNWYRANPLPSPASIGPTKVPTLYVYGLDDIAFLPPTAQATAAHVEAPYTYLELPGYGHFLPETATPEILPALIDHLAGVDR